MSLEDVANRWRSEEHAGAVNEDFEAFQTQQRAERLRAAAEPVRVPINEASARTIAKVAWVVVDLLVQRFAGKKYALKEDEREAIETASIPAVQLYVPELPGGDLLTHPLAALAAVAGTIYAGKVFAPANQTVDAQARPAPARPAAAAPPPPATSTPPRTNNGAAAVAAAGARTEFDEATDAAA